ncbi:BCCT family transporter [Haloechinothrix alba]|uniref:BCCT family transporter n=1 Tax=Haloechinothrix alba TaxID=664784 RepID=UPI003CCB925A
MVTQGGQQGRSTRCVTSSSTGACTRGRYTSCWDCPWGTYASERGLPLRPAAGLYLLIGDRIYGSVGNLVVILAVFGTLFGLATSLGLGAQQVDAGLSEVFGHADAWSPSARPG